MVEASWLEFIITPWFMVMLISFGILIPLGVIGLVSTYHRINNWQKVRNGWIKGRKKLNPMVWIEMWLHPTGRKVKIMDNVEGFEFDLPLQYDKNMIGMVKKIENDPVVFNKLIKLNGKLKEMRNENKTKEVINNSKPPTKEEVEMASDILRRMVK